VRCDFRNPKLVQAINNIKNNPLPFEFTPEHVAMFEIINAMMAGRLSVAGVSLASSLSLTFLCRRS
jgi:hypothetical protein